MGFWEGTLWCKMQLHHIVSRLYIHYQLDLSLMMLTFFLLLFILDSSVKKSLCTACTKGQMTYDPPPLRWSIYIIYLECFCKGNLSLHCHFFMINLDSWIFILYVRYNSILLYLFWYSNCSMLWTLWSHSVGFCTPLI